MLAGAAVTAFVRIDDRSEEGESREETQYGSHRTDCIAIGSSANPGQNADHEKGHSGNDGGRENRLDERCRNAAECAVRCQQRRH